jgi:hypothetical protein
MTREQVALLWAANGNSIPTTFWTLFHLLENPVAWDAVKKEVQMHLPVHALDMTTPTSIDAKDFSLDKGWSTDDLNRCVLLGSALDEAMRLAASSMLLRVATDATELVVDEVR